MHIYDVRVAKWHNIWNTWTNFKQESVRFVTITAIAAFTVLLHGRNVYRYI